MADEGAVGWSSDVPPARCQPIRLRRHLSAYGSSFSQEEQLLLAETIELLEGVANTWEATDE